MLYDVIIKVDTWPADLVIPLFASGTLSRKLPSIHVLYTNIGSCFYRGHLTDRNLPQAVRKDRSVTSDVSICQYMSVYVSICQYNMFVGVYLGPL